ncbi:MAG: aromatic acid exporter family protein [Fastidiosipila sp.]|nr:aromatic acid exporter family protein [Fastidiosipila sp.]
MIKENIIKGLKITIGVVAAILLAGLLNLEFQATAVTVFIVAMLSSKKQSLKFSGTLLLAAVFSLGLASALFVLLGFSLPVFALYVLIFTLTMHKFDAKSAIITNIVLVMHLYTIETISFPILLNQLALMLVGISVSFVINIFDLDIEAELLDYCEQVEVLFDSIYRNMGERLSSEGGADKINEKLEKLDRVLNQAKKRSYDYLHSFYLEYNDYYLEYFNMRNQQYQTVVAMQKYTRLDFLDQTEVKLLRDFTDRFAGTTRNLTTSQAEKESLDAIKHHFIYLADLPTTNMQLRNRVALHQYLYALDNLVKLELNFIDRYKKNHRSLQTK